MSEITTYYDPLRLGHVYLRDGEEVYFLSDVAREQAKTHMILDRLRNEPFYQQFLAHQIRNDPDLQARISAMFKDAYAPDRLWVPTMLTSEPSGLLVPPATGTPLPDPVPAPPRVTYFGSVQVSPPPPPDHASYPGFLAATAAETHRAIFTDRVACVPCDQKGCVLCSGKGWYEEET